ncbi:MAG TPA: hypothetical protein VG266_11015 [Candidatus Dormibacteraeota bacterium]|jgi:hypothetical protein|nr:hypothetical protein [Candidatus Dormibacteraeota bacterium]
MGAMIVLIGLAILIAAAALWGHDSRDGFATDGWSGEAHVSQPRPTTWW